MFYVWIITILSAGLFGWDGEKRIYARFLEFLHFRGVQNRLEGLFLSDGEFLKFLERKLSSDYVKTQKKGRFFV